MTASGPIFEPGTTLRGTYQIIGPISRGGMGQVFEARHARLPGRLAIKVLSGEAPPGSPELARFRREAEIAASLRHPNIVQVIDFDQTPEGIPFLVMELLEGRDLAAELLATGPLPLERVVPIVEQVASAVAAAHGRGVVHRDLKPQNVFLVPTSGQKREFVKVLDFGISKVETADPLTSASNLVGTPQYMAPEQARGLQDEVDGRTDQFALAAITFEMLTGQAPFAGTDIPSTLFKVVHEQPMPLGEFLPRTGDILDPVLRRALSKAKADRFLSVLEFAEALAGAVQALNGDGPVPAGPGPGRPTSAPTLVAGQSRAGRWTGGLALMLAAGLLASLSVGALRLVGRRGRAPSPATPSTTTTAITSAPAVSPVPLASPPPPGPALVRAPRQPGRTKPPRTRPSPSAVLPPVLPPPSTEGGGTTIGADAGAPPTPSRRGSFIRKL